MSTKKKDAKKPISAKKYAELEEKLEAQLDYVQGLERTIAQIEAELTDCEERNG